MSGAIGLLSADNQGGRYAGTWTNNYEDKSALINLPIEFPVTGRFGVISPAGTSGKVACYDVTKTQIGISTSQIGTLVASFLAIGY